MMGFLLLISIFILMLWKCDPYKALQDLHDPDSDD